MNNSLIIFRSVRLVSCLILSMAMGHTQAQTGATGIFRMWKSTDGRPLEAEFLSLAGEIVKIKGRNGQVFEVPLSRFSAEDQAFAKAQTPAVTAATTAPSATSAEKTWPRAVGLDDKPEVTVVKEDAATKEFIYRSPHYEFVCDSRLGGNVVREFGRMFEATYLLNCKLPLDLKPTPEPLREYFKARLFTNRDDYLAGGGIQGSGGVYRSGEKALMVPLSSLGVKLVGSRVTLDKAGDDDNATLIHEITHQMMNHWLGALPTWVTEGSAEYTEILEYNDNGRFALGNLRKRLEDYALRGNYWQTGPFMMLDLKELVEIDGRRWAAALTLEVDKPRVKGADQATQNYASAGLLTYYFYHLDGAGDAANIIAYYRALEGQRNEKEEPAAFQKHLLRERSYEKLAEDVKKAFKKAGVSIEFESSGKNGPVSAAP